MNLRSWATPLTMGSGLVVIISGILLFFHAGGFVAHVSHEWIGWVMVVAVLAHLAINWRAFKNYLRKPVGMVLLGLGMLLTFASFLPIDPPAREGGDMRAISQHIIESVETSSLDMVADISGKSLEDVQMILQAEGLDAQSGVNIREITGGDRETQMRVLGAIFN